MDVFPGLMMKECPHIQVGMFWVVYSSSLQLKWFDLLLQKYLSTYFEKVFELLFAKVFVNIWILISGSPQLLLCRRQSPSQTFDQAFWQNQCSSWNTMNYNVTPEIPWKEIQCNSWNTIRYIVLQGGEFSPHMKWLSVLKGFTWIAPQCPQEEGSNNLSIKAEGQITFQSKWRVNSSIS